MGPERDRDAMRFLLASVLIAVAMLVAPVANADGPGGHLGGSVGADPSTVDLVGSQPVPDGGTTADQAGVNAPALSFARIPACAGNNIETGVDVPCPESATACGVPGQFQYWLFSAPYVEGSPLTIGQAGWSYVGTICTAPGAAGEPAFPGISREDFQRLPLPAGGSTVEPPGQYVLVNMPTNVFTTSTAPVVLNTTVLGIAVQVRATPERWAWDFGDGTVVGPTSNPGAAYPALTNTHAYAARGTYDIVMTTYYSGEFSLDGATWYPIQGEAQVDSAPVTVQALAGSNVLVAEP